MTDIIHIAVLTKDTPEELVSDKVTTLCGLVVDSMDHPEWPICRKCYNIWADDEKYFAAMDENAGRTLEAIVKILQVGNDTQKKLKAEWGQWRKDNNWTENGPKEEK